MVKINGKEYDFANKTAAAALEEIGLLSTRIAVEKNGDILPKAQLSTTILQDGDSLEVVSFVGGG